jgi:hypothetical protein
MSGGRDADAGIAGAPTFNYLAMVTCMSVAMVAGVELRLGVLIAHASTR